MMRSRSAAVLIGISLAALTGRAAQQPAPLPMGKAVAGTAADGASAMYEFAAKSAGVLTVALQGTGDLALLLTDSEGQPVADGTADRDLFNSLGTEQLTVMITEAGRYRLEVRQQESGSAKFQIAASWLAFAPFARPADPDKRPSQAQALEIGRTHDDSLDSGAGDHWDWFVFTAKTAGVLTVILRPADADQSMDLVLELYTADDLATPEMRSDQDLQDNMANESATLTVTAGQKVYARVTNNSSGAGKYRVSTTLIQ